MSEEFPELYEVSVETDEMTLVGYITVEEVPMDALPESTEDTGQESAPEPVDSGELAKSLSDASAAQHRAAMQVIENMKF
ncbi:hypothetical protein GCM10009850_042530 [Nonomuraea monospora]|uniref:Uncharacterized protein n=2 Tax=Nonomuraea TaxID=83681 RepID=A0A1M4EEG4_9ACTN|nr:hypothetical protein [Nonomuraea gerenzanensis]UBU08837.1 hypothetical protein LCN96_31135 [Nonomuraea gerenzanensis]SBO97200.1 hypothetical protein BN4615_P6716 [Nonomuraea gerenzanensis]